MEPGRRGRRRARVRRLGTDRRWRSGLQPAPPSLRLAARTTLPYKKADARDITKVINDFSNGAGAGGERLFFYFSGHGLSAPGATSKSGDLEPQLIPADVADLPLDSRLCVSFSDIMPALRFAAPEEQFFFIDACRDFPFAGYQPAAALSPGVWTAPPLTDSQSAQFVLYATSPGHRAQESKALNRAVFGTTLLEGLRGEPGATSWTAGEYLVEFVRLAEFVKRRTRERIEAVGLANWENYLQEPHFQVRASGAAILSKVPSNKMGKVEVILRLSPKAAYETCQMRLLYSLPDEEVAGEGRVDGPTGRAFDDAEGLAVQLHPRGACERL